MLRTGFHSVLSFSYDIVFSRHHHNVDFQKTLSELSRFRIYGIGNAETRIDVFGDEQTEAQPSSELQNPLYFALFMLAYVGYTVFHKPHSKK
jgi:hypothetical protein